MEESCGRIIQGEECLLPQPSLLHRYFENQVLNNQEQANSCGLFYQGHNVCYTEVNNRANLLALLLKEHLEGKITSSTNANRTFLIAVDIEPSEHLIVALLAIWKLGLAYMPVDSQSAFNRVKYIINEANPVCILVDASSAFKKDKNTVWSRYLVLDFEELLVQVLTKVRSRHVTNLSQGDLLTQQSALAVIYTSGSTGRPKGVILNHQCALNRLYWQWETLPFVKEEVGCFKTSLLFVDSIVEIFSCVLHLTPMVICTKGITRNPEAFVKFLEEQHVSRLVMVPSLLRSMLFYLSISGQDTRLLDLQLWISNSETLKPELLEKFFQTFPKNKVFANFYGSTETMADVTYEIFRSRSDIPPKVVDGNLSIGLPMFNSNIYIVDQNMKPVTDREIGEICVSGLNVAQGYLDSSIGPQHFIVNPFSKHENHRVLYKTGDFGRFVRGLIIYEGRRDLQVKIRGQRVNIAEIEQVLQGCQEVDKVIVLCHQFSEISNVIVAYFTTHSQYKKKKPHRLDAYLMGQCKKSLPPYMIPKVLQMDEIPLQPYTGKVDQLALRKVYEKVFNRQSSQELAILDEKSRKAMNILALNLNLPNNAIPADKSFFELGGNSVTMISTIVQLREYALHIPIEIFCQAKTVQDIVDHVCVTTAPIGETMSTDRFVVKCLTDVPNNDKIIHVLAESFIEKEPLDVLLGVTKEEILPFAANLHRQAVTSKLSLIVLDTISGDIVGGDFLFDYFQGITVEHHESMAPVLALLNSFEEPIKSKLAQENPGKLLFNFCLCVHKDLPHADQVKMCHLIEANVLQVAEENGFAGVITNNTNPATQDICEHFFDYQLLSKFLVKDFEYHGRKVFDHAQDDYFIKMMIKYVKGHTPH